MADDTEVLERHTEVEEQRYAEIVSSLGKLKEKIMSDEAKVYNTLGGGDGMGLGGGGLLSAVVLASLFGNNRFGAGNNVEGIVTPSMLSSSLNQVTTSQQASATAQTLGDIKASVPLAEGQVQLALSAQATQLMQQMNTNALSAQAGIGDIRRDVAGANAVNIAAFASMEKSIVTASSAIVNTLRDDGDKTRALIVAQNEANLQRMLTVAEAALAEQRAENRVRASEINITNTNTATANQIQLQTQSQQQFQILAQLAANINNLANDIQVVRQTQSNINFGVQGNAGQSQAATNNRVN